MRIFLVAAWQIEPYDYVILSTFWINSVAVLWPRSPSDLGLSANELQKVYRFLSVLETPQINNVILSEAAVFAA